MARFPFFKEVEGADALIVGGGRIALHKARVLAGFGARIRAVSTSFAPGFDELDAKCQTRPFSPEDLEGADLAVAATSDPAVNARVGKLCREKGIEVNVADDAELSTFQFPAILRRGGMTAAVSSGGASPVAAKYIRDRIAEAIPENFGEVLKRMEAARQMAKAILEGDQRLRERALRDVFARCMEREELPSDAELKKWIEEYQNAGRKG